MQSRADAAVWPLCPRSLGNRTNWRERGIRVGEHGADGAEAQVACPRVARSKVLAYGMALVLFMLAHLRRPGEKYRYAGAHGSMQGSRAGAAGWTRLWSGVNPRGRGNSRRRYHHFTSRRSASASSHAPLHLITPRQMPGTYPRGAPGGGSEGACRIATSVRGRVSPRLYTLAPDERL